MARKTVKKAVAKAGGAKAMHRRDAVKELLGDGKDLLVVTGLGGPANDVAAALGGDSKSVFALGGAMGGATMTGLGLALAQPKRKVVVVTGDGELLMSVGSLAAVAVLNPPNFSIVCVDNGHYGETGMQAAHTSRGVDLAAMAEGAGIAAVRQVTELGQVAEAAKLMRRSNGTSFIHLKVDKTDDKGVPRSRDATWHKNRFRENLLGAA